MKKGHKLPILEVAATTVITTLMAVVVLLYFFSLSNHTLCGNCHTYSLPNSGGNSHQTSDGRLLLGYPLLPATNPSLEIAIQTQS